MQIIGASVTMLLELHANKGGNVSSFAGSTLTFRMVEQKRQSGTYLKVHANNFFMPKQGGPVQFTFHFGCMP